MSGRARSRRRWSSWSRVAGGAWASQMRLHLLLAALWWWWCGARAQVVHTTDSVDIQVCVSGLLGAPSRGAFQAALATFLQTELASTAVYLDSTFTDNAQDYCLWYVYQAPNPTMARQALEALNPRGVAAPVLALPFQNAVVNGTVTATQWSGDSTAYLGVPLPGAWSVNDLLLWGACIAGGLALCVGGACCYAGCVTSRADDEAAQSLLRTDREILRVLAAPPPAAKPAKAR